MSFEAAASTCHKYPWTVPRSTLDSMERQLPANTPKDEPKSAGSRAMIPELVQHIISHIDPPPDRQQYKKLMLVSRLFFNCVVPALWKNVPNPETLLALIPALTIKREAVDKQNRAGAITIRFSSSAYFTRFEFYAGYVQSLVIDAVRYKVRNQHVLKTYCSAKDNALLPNLTSISYIHDPLLDWSQNPFVTWLGWTLGPTLSRFQFYPSPRRPYPSNGLSTNTEIETILRVQELIGQRCANIQTLETQLRCSNPSLNKPLLHSALSSSNNLYTISGNQHLIEPQSLRVLSTIPSLKSLKVQSTGGDFRPADATSISWPENPFPSFSSLYLGNFASDAVQYLIAISPLVAPLRSIQIVLDPRTAVTNGQWSQNFIRNIPTCMPHLNELILTASNIPKNRSELTKIELNALAQLPLRHLDLFGIGFAYSVTSQDIALALPNARILRLGSMIFTIKDLQQYANRLPNLEILGCFAVLLDETPIKRSPFEHEIVLEIYDLTDITPGQLPLYARCIGELWRHVSCTRNDHSLHSRAGELLKFTPLNEAINVYQRGRKAPQSVP